MNLMKMILIGSILWFGPCSNSNSNYDLEKIKYRNYKAALKNHSTFHYFIVIEVKNLKTGKSREYCSTENLIRGAYHIEHRIGYDEEEMKIVDETLLENEERRFEFRRKKAIKNISSNNYTKSEYDDLATKLDNSSFLEEVQNNDEWEMWIPDNKEMKMYAHYLFNHGILTGENGSFGGTLKKISEQEINYLESK